MRFARILVVAVLLAAGLSAAALAQDRITAPGTYAAKVGVVPGMLPDAGASLPPELQSVGPDLYVGEVTINAAGRGYEVRFMGRREDGAQLLARASFSSEWTGLLLGSLVVGSTLESDVITGIDVAHLVRGFVNGVGTVNGGARRVLAWIGPGGVVERSRILPAPGPFGP